MTTINCTSKMTKGLELNGNVLTGDTYPIREHIKTHWSGKWDGATKAWIVDGAKVIDMINAKDWGFCKVLEISDTPDSTHPSNVQSVTRKCDNGWCSRCNSWCYGDCTS